MAELELGLPGQFMPPADRAVNLAMRAEQDGFASMWFPCHHMGWHPESIWTEDLTPLAAVQPSPHVYFDPLMMMAAVGSQTSNLRVGSVVTDLIRRNPVMAAQQALTLDHLTHGRAIIGLGSGESMNITPYGLPFDRPVARLAEGVEIMRALWEHDESFSFEGKFTRLEDAVLGLRPYGALPPEIWIAAHGPRMLELTGRLADGWLPTKVPIAAYSEALAAIRASRKEAGVDVDRFTPGMLGYVLLAPDEQTLNRLIREPLVRALCIMLPPPIYRALGYEPPLGEDAFHSFIPTRVSREEALAIVDRIPPDIVREYAFCGTAEQVSQEILAYQHAGLRHLICWNITGFGDPQLARWSFDSIREVRAHLANA